MEASSGRNPIPAEAPYAFSRHLGKLLPHRPFRNRFLEWQAAMTEGKELKRRIRRDRFREWHGSAPERVRFGKGKRC